MGIEDEVRAQRLRELHEFVTADMSPEELERFERRRTPEYREASQQFGRHLAERRLALGRGLFQVARMSDSNPRYIDAIELGFLPDAEMFREICPAYTDSPETAEQLLRVYQLRWSEAHQYLFPGDAFEIIQRPD